MRQPRSAAIILTTALWAAGSPFAAAARQVYSQSLGPSGQVSDATYVANTAQATAETTFIQISEDQEAQEEQDGRGNGHVNGPQQDVNADSSDIEPQLPFSQPATNKAKLEAQEILKDSFDSLSELAVHSEAASTAAAAEHFNKDAGVSIDAIDQAECLSKPLINATHNDVYLPNLHIELNYRSSRPRELSDITIVSQLSMDRLQMLSHLCNVWGGIISAAVYLPLLSEHSAEQHAETIAIARKQLQDFHSTTDEAGGCRLDLALVSERIRQAMLFAYPYNALRNTALLRAETDVVLLLDVDFAVSAGLHERLSGSAEALLKDTSQYRHAIVLPAFETNPSLSQEEALLTARKAVSGSKLELEVLFRTHQIIQFAEFYPAGHQPTKYNTWFEATSPYPTRFRMGYEPYILVSRAMVPLYDERFRGYGFDKVMHLWQMHVQGFHFVAHPTAFVVHRPHAPSAGYKAAFTGPAYTTEHRSTGHMDVMKHLSEDMIREVKLQSYPAAGVSAIAHCRPLPKQQPRLDAWW